MQPPQPASKPPSFDWAFDTFSDDEGKNQNDNFDDLFTAPPDFFSKSQPQTSKNKKCDEFDLFTEEELEPRNKAPEDKNKGKNHSGEGYEDVFENNTNAEAEQSQSNLAKAPDFRSLSKHTKAISSSSFFASESKGTGRGSFKNCQKDNGISSDDFFGKTSSDKG